jgi:hypothetical protein
MSPVDPLKRTVKQSAIFGKIGPVNKVATKVKPQHSRMALFRGGSGRYPRGGAESLTSNKEPE